MKKMIVMLALIIGISAIAQNDEPKKQEQEAVVQTQEIYTAAVFPFVESGEGVKDMGKQIGDLLYAALSPLSNTDDSKILLYNRDSLNLLLNEAEQTLSGTTNPDTAIRQGEFVGAKIIITGSIFKIKEKNFIIAKVIGTETTRVLGKSIDGNETIDILVQKLAPMIFEMISKDAKKLMPEVKERKDILAILKKSIGDAKKPKVCIKVEERHVGQFTSDPAASTEIEFICKELGFDVTTKENDADIVVKGEGFSEFAGRRGNLLSLRARLEVKALDKNGNIVAVDRQTTTEIDLTEQIAGKKALQEAAAKIAERLLPKIVKK